jgi:hypothetical protein
VSGRRAAALARIRAVNSRPSCDGQKGPEERRVAVDTTTRTGPIAQYRWETAGPDKQSGWTTEEVICRDRTVTQQLPDATTVKGVQMARTCATRWTSPPPDTWKMNVDAACWAKEMDGAWGFVIRDHQGSAVLAGAGRLAVVCDALCAESHACIEALQVAADHGMQRVIVETASQRKSGGSNRHSLVSLRPLLSAWPKQEAAPLVVSFLGCERAPTGLSARLAPPHRSTRCADLSTFLAANL